MFRPADTPALSHVATIPEVRTPSMGRMLAQPSEPILLGPADWQRFVAACGLTTEQEEADAREQAAIAAAVDGVLP